MTDHYPPADPDEPDRPYSYDRQALLDFLDAGLTALGEKSLDADAYLDGWSAEVWDEAQATAVAAGHAVANPYWAGRPRSALPAGLPSGVPASFLFNASVVRVVDGDTVEVIVDRGMYDYGGSAEHPIPIRLYGVNAREHNDPGGPEATANLEQLLPVGLPIVLRTMKPDKYNPRWLAIIETATVPDLSAHLVATQWAAVYFGIGTPKPVPPWPRTEV